MLTTLYLGKNDHRWVSFISLKTITAQALAKWAAPFGVPPIIKYRSVYLVLTSTRSKLYENVADVDGSPAHQETCADYTESFFFSFSFF